MCWKQEAKRKPEIFAQNDTLLKTATAFSCLLNTAAFQRLPAQGNFAEPERESWIAGTLLEATGAKLGRTLQKQTERGCDFFPEILKNLIFLG